MYSLSAVLTFTLAGLIAGTFIGIFFTQRKSGHSQHQAELEKQILEMQQQQQSYQTDVSKHFNHTAELLNQLTENYKEVHSHLAEGAQRLAGEQLHTTIKTLTADGDISEEQEPEAPTPLTPPLDYAATGGTLSEDWGMKKSLTAEERNDLGYPKTPA
ncbi:YhcB family protein [Dasania sp. GY-MA-18]|uniref:Z-ring associated protein G n=1 Tax=Dasania phycosphaerae TaxID=2950436 RepID=A0A9J6RP87_9GAMM|nr:MULTISPECIES: YhcB family protein [Dasania]MCR8923712.1 YhcB family protein [Dasania sp. GY-MA-18]MCZ0866146.1 YhcB family protein [Dasania phycosphaerae]MCZ0869870.1 YhcB family protein [Dasania phycosphaerae]